MSRQFSTRKSAGIALYSNGKILLAHKRYTYAFANFIQGKYDIKTAHLIKFSEMTKEELFDILSFNFEQMWYRVWLSHFHRDLMEDRKAKFNILLQHLGGQQALRQIILATKTCADFLWILPKGQHDQSEGNLECAIREFYEETGIAKSSYTLLSGANKSISYEVYDVAGFTRYECTYYFAISPEQYNYNKLDMTENSEYKWFSLKELELLNIEPCVRKVICTAFKLAKKYKSGRWRVNYFPRVLPPPASKTQSASGGDPN